MAPVTPFFPEPTEVEGNVASLPYDARLAFIRKLFAGHGASVAWASVAGVWAGAWVPWQWAAWVVGSALAVLLLSRLAAGGTRAERPVVWIAGPMLVAGLGAGAVELSYAEIPAWTLGLAALCAAAYALLCGRDFSFVGQFGFSALTFAGLVIGLAWYERTSLAEAWTGLIMGLSYLGYLVYDASALLSRRRPDELPEAVADLYRDWLNVFSYAVRVYRHWTRGGFRI